MYLPAHHHIINLIDLINLINLSYTHSFSPKTQTPTTYTRSSDDYSSPSLHPHFDFFSSLRALLPRLGANCCVITAKPPY